MKPRKVYHVTPHGDDWKVKAEGSKRAVDIIDNKADAVERAIELAKSNPLGQVKIHKQDGTIQTEHTYGKDPFPPKG
jgi:uncharacterized protein YdaT